MIFLALTITSCVSVPAFVSLACVPAGIISSVVGIKICAFTAGIKKYKSIIKKKKKRHDEIVLLGKDELNTVEVLICKALINSHISHNKFVSVNNKLTEVNKMEKEIKKLLKRLLNTLYIYG